MHGPRLFWLGCVAAALLSATTVRAYVLEGYHWPPDQPIVLDLQLGTPAQPLIDGSTTWNQVAGAAMKIWNPYLESGVQFTEHDDAVAPRERNGKNEVFFSYTVYGEEFGDDTLAITLSFFNKNTKLKAEADVLFNLAKTFDSYRGDLRLDRSGRGAYDLRRVAIHEFGHVLGLEHVSQGTAAIMTPVTTDIDTIQADDIAGVRAIYTGLLQPPVITSDLSVNATTGGQFAYRIVATGAGVTFAVNDLPTGLALDKPTGIIEGKIGTPGTYRVGLTVTNGVGTATATLTITVNSPPQITSPGTATAQRGQLFLYQITATAEPTIFGADDLPPGLVVDAATGLISGVPQSFGYFSIDLGAVNAVGKATQFLELHVLPDNAVAVVYSFDANYDNGIPGSTPIQGADGNFYGTTDPGNGVAYRLTPDGTVTILHRFTDGNATVPSPLVQGADGNFYGVSSRDGTYGGGSVFKMTPDGTLTALYSFQAPTGGTPLAALVQGRDGNFYGTTSSKNAYAANAGTIFRITPDGALTVLHDYGQELSQPSALLQVADGDFYGVSVSGGDFSAGSVYRLTPDGTVTILHSFNGADGFTPQGPLVQAADGNFYGTTRSVQQNGPGSFGTGSVFRLTPDGTLTTIHVFGVGEGASPSALTLGPDGNLYGVTDLSGADTSTGVNGVLYRVTTDGAFTILHTFTASDGFSHLALILARDGSFYGMETETGSGAPGVIYKTTLGAPPIAAIAPPVTLAATRPHVTAGGGGHGQFTVSMPTAQASDVVVFYKLKGDALDGTDFKHLTGSVTIKAGMTSASIKIKPRGDLHGTGQRVVKLVLTPLPSYKLDGPAAAKVKILAP